MKFWLIRTPCYKSDYQHSFINGELVHKYSVPIFSCKECNNNYHKSHVLPVALPSKFRRDKIFSEFCVVEKDDYEKIESQIAAELFKDNHNDKVYPGAYFQPNEMRIPSNPYFEFLWPQLGCPVVSKRIKEIIEEFHLPNVFFFPVKFTKIGDRKPKGRPPMPNSGEPEDIIDSVKPISNPNLNKNYFEMIIQGASKLPPGGEPKEICQGCGRKFYDDEKRKIVFKPEMWEGQEIFFLKTTLYIIISDKIKMAIEKISPENILFNDATDENSYK